MFRILVPEPISIGEAIEPTIDNRISNVLFGYLCSLTSIFVQIQAVNGFESVALRISDVLLFLELTSFV
ncbi:hypothetical protein C444_17177 [Haloarcula japonica DSM 6131]|uniref:Uncharacterized protein n=1 Tax=Haloarcula japonica (strain ATCC 49778 / DSM 6131 / JCM 7785 / NBRC 101032 / NCIMB 13157 / TR-1) TaxID=1227453 RepID=M0L3X6_HALJT|nr:hypothetical protein C444_17177 [Haloarcula japonica DSM 6131]